MGSFFVYVGGVLIVAYAIWGLLLFFMQSKLLYRPVRDVTLSPAERNLDFEEVAFPSGDGVALTGWYVPAPQAQWTVLFCHGNGGSMMHRLDSLSLFFDLGLNCLVFDYRGYGHSAGKPSEAGTYLDARAAYEWLIREKRVPPEQIILFGRSLGGSIAAHLAGRVRARALIVESAFTSYPDIAARFYPYLPVRPFARFRYDTLACVREVRCPVLVMHSKDDDFVPFEFGTRIFDAAREPKQFVEIVGNHNDGFLVSGDIYRDAWANWLAFVKDYEAQGSITKAS